MSGVFVNTKTRQMGPLSAQELVGMAEKGEFCQSDFVFQEDTQEWVKAGNLEEYSDVFISKKPAERKRTVFAIGGGKGGVGKTILTASLGVGLAALEHKTIIVDADLGGANLHTCMGILEPKYTFYDFYSLQRDKLEDILLDTPVEYLKLISGACGTLGLANPRYSQKRRFISQLRRLDADFILLDLGAGSSYNVIDFFIAADQGVLVTTPEPMAIQETFNFLKISLLRKFIREFKDNSQAMDILERDVINQPGRMNRTMNEIIEEISSVDIAVAERISGFLARFSPKLILNMVHDHNEIKEGDSFVTAAQELLSVECDYIGYVDYDDTVRTSVKKLKPHILQNPKSKASKSFARLVSAGLLKKTGLKAYREKRKVMRQVSEEGKGYPAPDLSQSKTICSIRCFYWDDCEYQNGGHPCSIRHLDPIFRM